MSYQSEWNIISYHPSKEGDIIFISTSGVFYLILPEGFAFASPSGNIR